MLKNDGGGILDVGRGGRRPNMVPVHLSKISWVEAGWSLKVVTMFSELDDTFHDIADFV